MNLRHFKYLLDISMEWVAVVEDVWVFAAKRVAVFDEFLRRLDFMVDRMQIPSYHNRRCNRRKTLKLQLKLVAVAFQFWIIRLVIKVVASLLVIF